LPGCPAEHAEILLLSAARVRPLPRLRALPRLHFLLADARRPATVAQPGGCLGKKLRFSEPGIWQCRFVRLRKLSVKHSSIEDGEPRSRPHCSVPCWLRLLCFRVLPGRGSRRRTSACRNAAETGVALAAPYFEIVPKNLPKPATK
jgi:hypothetical protein